MTQHSAFDLQHAPLTGSHLIEASAGTGKTWTLCGLYLRFIVERGLAVDELLVVTFTKAATAELRSRIRSRLAETLAQLHSGQPDENSVALLDAAIAQGVSPAQVVCRLVEAIESFDQAAIFTIHGFCQRALADTAFAAASPYDCEMTEAGNALCAAAVRDAWRRHISHADLPPWLATLLAEEDTPEAWAPLLSRMVARPLAELRWPAPAQGDPEAAFAAAHETARRVFDTNSILGTLTANGKALSKNTYSDRAIAAASDGWQAMLSLQADAVPDKAPPKLDLFTPDSLLARTNKGQGTPQHAFFAAAENWLAAHQARLKARQQMRRRLMRQVLEDARDTLARDKRAQRLVAFDDMLANLHTALNSAQGKALAGRLRQRYPVAMIDEFQDTDPLQYAIFNRLAEGGEMTSYFVGDPKQAIYSFRNADLNTYLAARNAAGSCYTLTTNFRSRPPLIDAFNHLFLNHDRAFLLDGLDYPPVHAPGGEPAQLVIDGNDPAPLQVWQLPQGDDGSLLGKGVLEDRLTTATASEIARLLTQGEAGRARIGERPVVAADVAVLVRSHAQAAAVQRALRARGVDSVALSQASVFQSEEAEGLSWLLAAVLEPAHSGGLRAALASPIHGLDSQSCDALAEADELSRHQLAFVALRDTWFAHGISALFRQWQAEYDIVGRLLAQADGERRLTNLRHLVELLHEESRHHDAPEHLLQWLDSERQQAEEGGDHRQLRLETDRKLVQVLTIHAAKGLQYPLVYCPFLWAAGKDPTAEPEKSHLADYHAPGGQRVLDFSGNPLDGTTCDALRDDACAEDLRLIYVALTRAELQCTFAAGAYRDGNSRKPCAGAALNWLAGDGRGNPWQARENKTLTGSDGALAEAINSRWQSLVAKSNGTLAWSLPPESVSTAMPRPVSAPTLAARALPTIPHGYRMASFSSLAEGAHHEAGDHDPLEDYAPEASASATPPGADDICRFPRGASAGDCLHALFEWADFTAPAGWPAVADRALTRYPQPIEMADAKPMLLRLLGDVLATPLVPAVPDLRLCAIAPRDRLSELPFHLKSSRFAASALNHWFAEHAASTAPAFAFRPLSGYLKGFIDLVFRHAGRYYLLDWKSNHLGEASANYAPAQLNAAMLSHGYALQARLYSAALHRHLRLTLPGYDPARHFGGAFTLFVRGVRPEWQHNGAPCGVVHIAPTPAELASFDQLFEGETA